MSRQVNDILVIRLHLNMAEAVSTQNIRITAFGFENQINMLIPESLAKSLKIIPRDFRRVRTVFDGFRDISVLSKLIKDEKPDIVHVNAIQDLLFAFIAVHLFVPWKNSPAIIAMARNPLTWKNSRRAWLAAKLIRFFADGFVALATTHKHQLLGLGIPENRLTVIPNPYDVDQIKLKDLPNDDIPSITSKVPRIVYVANICERKAQDILIRAASLVLKKHPGVNFNLIGGVIQGEENYAERIYSLTSELNIYKQVHFIGAVSYQEATDLLATSDIFAFPSRSEMMPRAVIEAMLAGKPVIASAVDGILELIQNRETGILVQPGNIEELADAICELIEKPSLANELGLAGQNYVLEYCSPERVGSLFRDFYQSIIDRKLTQF